MTKKGFLWTGVIIAVFLFGYWLKCQTQINVFDRVSLSDSFPFNKLQRNNIISHPTPGILLEDTFDSKRIFGQWASLWMREPGAVTQQYDSKGVDGSRCLYIVNRGSNSWSFGHNMFVKVKKGDRFAFSGAVHMHGEGLRAFLRVSAYDNDKKAVKWTYEKENAKESDRWTPVKKAFTIQDDIAYIRFGLVGVGKGVFRFDNIRFEKL